MEYISVKKLNRFTISNRKCFKLIINYNYYGNFIRRVNKSEEKDVISGNVYYHIYHIHSYPKLN